MKPLNGRVVALSVGNSPELARLGYGPEHLDEALLRIGRALLKLGARLAFGGSIRSGGFGRILEELVQSERMNEREEEADPKLLIYQPWPRDVDVTPEVVARSVGIVRYFRIAPRLPPGRTMHPAVPNAQSPQLSWQTARAFSLMREAVTYGGAAGVDGTIAPRSDARIVLGGQCEDFNGAMPGIAEESLYALEAEGPLYILGGFGGAARLVASALLSDQAPEQLALGYQRRASAKFRLMFEGFAKYEPGDFLPGLFGRLESALSRARQGFPASLRNGLSEEENRQLMQSEDLTAILALLRAGLCRALSACAEHAIS